jgi:hypothetical protein
MRVVLEGEKLIEITVDSGVSQSTVLGPILFLCHINYLPDAVKSQVCLLADDCLLIPSNQLTERPRHSSTRLKKFRDLGNEI